MSVLQVAVALEGSLTCTVTVEMHKFNTPPWGS